MPFAPQGFEQLQAAHGRHVKAGNEQGRDRTPYRIALQIPDHIRSIGEEFNTVLNSTLPLMYPERENIVRIIRRN
jgi:hypothetical protein